MTDRVNALKNGDLGEWRGHDVRFDVDKLTFYSESAGIRDAKTLAEVKRLIDAQARKKYRPIKALHVGGGRYSYGSGRTAKIEPYTIVAPAFSASRYGGRDREVEVWAINSKGGREKLSLCGFVLDTPANRVVIERARALVTESKRIDKESDKVMDSLTAITELPAELDPGEEDE